jgi:hypothetical protein
MKYCTECKERVANHNIYKWWETPSHRHLCCSCYVHEGNTPTDWHPLCMITYHKVIENKIQGGDK